MPTSDYDAIASVYDAFASSLSEDVDLYGSLATEASAPGWFDRRPFDEESREFVYVARKP